MENHQQPETTRPSLGPTDLFPPRHIGPREDEIREMLQLLGLSSLDQLVEKTVPASIRLDRNLNLGRPRGEHELLDELKSIASRNKVFRSFIGQGYHDTITPPVILRNILENPGWYTQYTPYQAEISQGRLEALLNFQTMVADLTALPLASASLLDEGTAAAEAMAMCRGIVSPHSDDETERPVFFVAQDCHPQTIAVVQTRARSMGIDIQIGDPLTTDLRTLSPSPGTPGEGRGEGSAGKLIGILLQYPTTDGRIVDYTDVIAKAHEAGALAVVAADILALTLIKPPGEFGADIAVGSTQRFGVPMGFGGPHAAYMATKAEYARKMPGRIVGVSKDIHGNPAYRLAIQTREQHIRREKATSNICTAQVLLAIMASMYAVYHGPEGLKRIASRAHRLAALTIEAIRREGHEISDVPFFDTVKVKLAGMSTGTVINRAQQRQLNLRALDDRTVVFSVDEATTLDDVNAIINCCVQEETSRVKSRSILVRPSNTPEIADFGSLSRSSPYLNHPVFNTHHSETELLRYIFKLQSRDLSLAYSMIPLGSCTMKLNGTTEMIPVTWPEFARMHPFAPPEQTQGYQKLFEDLETWLAEITGFSAVSLQPNAGSQGEYAGLLAIRAYHESRKQAQRNVCLIPTSAHGTNPASAVIAGMRVVAVACDEQGNIDLADLRARAQEHGKDLSCLMVTYPSTHGVFEEEIREICKIVHDQGGQVYMDGANMNAQVGLCRPGDIGADVCHLNLHKTFCIPHGGGGPGMGPIGVAEHLAPFLPALSPTGNHQLSTINSYVGMVSAAPYGSAAILPIPWVYIALMGAEGLKRATQLAILNANYMAKRLETHYPVLFRGKNGFCAHEFILDCREFERTAGIKVEDIAKRLMDYGFHAPTMSWPVPGTLMIEPTESEPKSELDRLCDALIAIRAEIRDIEQGKMDRTDNPLRNAPHTMHEVTKDDWKHPYPRQLAAFPTPFVRQNKFWPAVGRIDNPYGDRNLVCACPPMSEHSAGGD